MMTWDDPDIDNIDAINKLSGGALKLWLRMKIVHGQDLTPVIQHYIDRAALHTTFDAVIRWCNDDVAWAKEQLVDAEKTLEQARGWRGLARLMDDHPFRVD